MLTFIIRHRKENRKKCTLTALENSSRFQFIAYPFKAPLPSFERAIVLSVKGAPLTAHDRGLPLILIDGTWRYAEKMLAALPLHLTHRSLPSQWQTAYPRRQEVEQGLASIEALFAAFIILGYSTEGLLDHYHWREAFLEKNRHLILEYERAKRSNPSL